MIMDQDISLAERTVAKYLVTVLVLPQEGGVVHLTGYAAIFRRLMIL